MTIERVRSLAKDRGISLTFICKKIGVASPYFLDLEKSNREIPDIKLKQIADVLFTTPEYLRGETDDPKPAAVPEVPVALSAPQGYDNLTDEQKELIQSLIDKYNEKNIGNK